MDLMQESIIEFNALYAKLQKDLESTKNDCKRFFEKNNVLELPYGHILCHCCNTEAEKIKYVVYIDRKPYDMVKTIGEKTYIMLHSDMREFVAFRKINDTLYAFEGMYNSVKTFYRLTNPFDNKFKRFECKTDKLNIICWKQLIPLESKVDPMLCDCCNPVVKCGPDVNNIFSRIDVFMGNITDYAEKIKNANATICSYSCCNIVIKVIGDKIYMVKTNTGRCINVYTLDGKFIAHSFDLYDKVCWNKIIDAKWTID